MLNQLSQEEKYYIIGLFQGDANHSENTRNRGKVQLEISLKDADLVYKLETILSKIVKVYISSRERKVIFKTGQKYLHTSITLSIYDLNFRKAIKPYVPAGSKCNIINAPDDMPKNMFRHYLRGLYDADGSLGITSQNIPYISMCAKSENIKHFICAHMLDTLGIEKKINRNKRDDIYNIMLTKEFSQQYSEILYKDSTIYLDRKYKKYLEVQSWERPSSMRKK